ncbi:hypothetical protein HNY73_008327 [Argiope bruennichi]|uniref:Uncharacterized protein n=1 Tax=Argiope bruennichi TaxID=94029 RepID=A0A8T0FBA4_ARGBR|nr:hypothetical protein HNY73_008327 [Argiope bruennichi]
MIGDAIDHESVKAPRRQPPPSRKREFRCSFHGGSRQKRGGGYDKKNEEVGLKGGSGWGPEATHRLKEGSNNNGGKLLPSKRALKSKS